MKKIIVLILFMMTFMCSAQRKGAVLYLLTDKPPRFENFKFDIENFLHQNIVWPKDIDGEGTVLVSFIVTKNGDISDVKIERSLVKDFDDEAIRVIYLLPKWIPGRVKGKKVDVIVYFPVRFRMES